MTPVHTTRYSSKSQIASALLVSLARDLPPIQITMALTHSSDHYIARYDFQKFRFC